MSQPFKPNKEKQMKHRNRPKNELTDKSNLVNNHHFTEDLKKRKYPTKQIDNQLEVVRELAAEVNEVTLDLQRQVNNLRKELVEQDKKAILAYDKAISANLKAINANTRLNKFKVLTIGTAVLVALHLIYVIQVHL